MAKVSGSNARLYIGGTLLAHSNSITINLDTDIEDVTDEGSGRYAENLPTLNRWNADATVWYNNTSTGVTLTELINTWQGQTQLTLLCEIETGVDYGGSGYLTNLSISGGTDAAHITFTAGFIGTGSLC